MFPLCVVISFPFSLKFRFLLTYLVLEEEGGCSVVFGEIALLFLFPLLRVLDFFEGDFPFSSGCRPFQNHSKTRNVSMPYFSSSAILG